MVLHSVQNQKHKEFSYKIMTLGTFFLCASYKMTLGVKSFPPSEISYKLSFSLCRFSQIAPEHPDPVDPILKRGHPDKMKIVKL